MEKSARSNCWAAGEKIKWKQTADALVIAQPKHEPNDFAVVYKIHGQIEFRQLRSGVPVERRSSPVFSDGGFLPKAATMRAMSDAQFMRLALRLARRGYGTTSPNPMVGAVLVKGGKIIGRGWHRRAGLPHAEIEALRDAQKRGHNPRGATLYVTLEPCCTHGRTPPCTDAIIAAGIKRVVVGATDPNPKHSGTGFQNFAARGD